MYFEEDHLYHVFNQGNNRQKIFFCDENYRYFLKKIEKHILPYADVLAYCLMPNHFHLMLKVNLTMRAYSSDDFKSSDESTKKTLNESIAIMLRSYTRAINKQEGRSGSLFRPKTKAQCLTQRDGLSPSYFNAAFGTSLNTDISEFNYPQQCFRYIHENPVNAGLVEKAEDWRYSSLMDYSGMRSETLVNKKVAKDEGLI